MYKKGIAVLKKGSLKDLRPSSKTIAKPLGCSKMTNFALGRLREKPARAPSVPPSSAAAAS
jgi:hypothetical protein